MDADTKKILLIVIDFLLFYALGLFLMIFIWGTLDQYTAFDLDTVTTSPTNWIFLLSMLGVPQLMGLGIMYIDVRKWKNGQKIKAEDVRAD